MHKDFELINRLTQGDETAMDDLMKLYKKKVYYFLYDLTGSREEAEDIAQDVFFKVYRSSHQFRGDAKLITWLYKIAYNRWIDQTRKKSLWILRASEDLDNVYESKLKHETIESNPTKNIHGKQISGYVQKAMDALSSKEKTAFVLRHYNDLSLSDISLSMNVKEGTVKSLLFRATRKLQNQLAFLKD